MISVPFLFREPEPTDAPERPSGIGGSYDSYKSRASDDDYPPEQSSHWPWACPPRSGCTDCYPEKRPAPVPWVDP